MSDLLSIDAARADEIVTLAVPALTAELPALDKPSLELVLAAEKAKGDAARVGAVSAIEAATAALDKIAADAAAAAEAEAKAKEEADAKAAADAQPVEPVVYDGHTEMRNADGGGCSWRGESYEPDTDGVVTVPVAAAADLIDHGFSFVAAKA